MNIFPHPKKSDLLKYKKKFYALKIDNDFDINYNDPNPTIENPNFELNDFEKKYVSSDPTPNTSKEIDEKTNGTNSNNTNATSTEHKHHNPHDYDTHYPEHSHDHLNPKPSSKPPTIFSQLIGSISCFIWIVFIFSSTLNLKSLNIATIGLLFDIIVLKGISFTKDYLLELFKEDLFQDIILIFIFNLFSYDSDLVYISIGITGLVAVSNYFRDYLRIFMFLKQIFVRINDFFKHYLLFLKAFLEISISIYLLFIISSWTNLLLFALYLHFLEYKNNYNSKVKHIFDWISVKIDSLDNLWYFPRLITWIMKQIRRFFVYKANFKL